MFSNHSTHCLQICFPSFFPHPLAIVFVTIVALESKICLIPFLLHNYHSEYIYYTSLFFRGLSHQEAYWNMYPCWLNNHTGLKTKTLKGNDLTQSRNVCILDSDVFVLQPTAGTILYKWTFVWNFLDFFLLPVTVYVMHKYYACSCRL